ncbi:dolichyl-diphosphooligosaccharide--protein glycosyltransferase subunit 1, partial [Ascosphaera atra]
AWHNLPSTALSQLVVPLTPAGKGGSGSGSAGGNPGDAYFIDDVGNVSTSHFRGGAGKKGNAVLELKPRYPLFGGWKYSFKIGWNAELSAFLRRVASTSSGENGGEDTYALKVPLIQPPRNGEGIQVDELVVRVVLPEGAREVRYELVDGAAMPDRKDVEAEIGTAKTFMDTVGRTVLRLRMRNVVDDARGGFLVVTYKYSTLDLLRKPFTFAVGMFAVYAAWWVLGKIDVSIKQR